MYLQADGFCEVKEFIVDRNSLLKGRMGMMVHYLPPFPLNDEYSFFDLDGFLKQFDRMNFDYLLFTLGQNTGWYNAPNEALDKYAGPGHCSERDIFGELAEAMAQRGKFILAYLPCEICDNTSLHKPLGWTTEENTDQALFQERYCEVIACWAERYGKLLKGWWFDGCYPWPIYHQSRVNFEKYSAAVRAGNPDALVTFNDGCFCNKITRPFRGGFDYFAGECVSLDKATGRPIKGFDASGETATLQECIETGFPETLPHLLVSTDAFWKHGFSPKCLGPQKHFFVEPSTLPPGVMEPPVYTAETLKKTVDVYCKNNGAVTFNLGIFPNGLLGEKTVELFSAFAK